MPETSISLSATSTQLTESFKALDCYDAYQALNHPYSSKEVDTKHHILVTAIGLIHENGFDSLTMNHLVDNSSVSRRTVYKYFTNKESLCTDIAILWAVHAQLRITLTNQNGVQTALSDCIQAIIDFALEHPQVLKAVCAGISYPSQHSGDVYRALENQLITTIDFFKPETSAKRTQKQAKTIHKALVESLIFNLVVLAANPDKKAEVIRHIDDFISILYG